MKIASCGTHLSSRQIESETPRSAVRVSGVYRDNSLRKAVLVLFDGEPSADDVRAVHDSLRDKFNRGRQ